MAINGVQPQGDDQRWKAEIERYIKKLEREIERLKTNTGNK